MKIVEIPVIKELISDKATKAIIQFGSSVNGDMWKKSDIDLFVIHTKTNEHSAFYLDSYEIPIHVNIITPKRFRTILKDPSKRTLHSILVRSKIICNKTDWLVKEKLRLKKYPLKNRALQLMPEFEQYFGLEEKIRKYLYLDKEHDAFSYLPALVEVFFKITHISQGIYYGTSVIQELSKRDQLQYERYLSGDVNNLKKMRKQINLFFSKQFNLFVKEKKLKSLYSYYELNKKAVVDLYQVYEEAAKLGLVSFDEKVTSVHGPKIKEKSVNFRRSNV